MNSARIPEDDDELEVVKLTMADSDETISIAVTCMVDKDQMATTDLSEATWFMGYSAEDSIWIEVDTRNRFCQKITWH